MVLSITRGIKERWGFFSKNVEKWCYHRRARHGTWEECLEVRQRVKIFWSKHSAIGGTGMLIGAAGKGLVVDQ